MTDTTTDPLHDGDNRPPAYYEDEGERRTLILRASGIGSKCLFELAAAGQGYDPQPLPDVIVRAFRRGHELEPVVIEQMKREELITFLTTQEEGHLPVPTDSGLVMIRFHSDGRAHPGRAFWSRQQNFVVPVDMDYNPLPVIVEVKCVSDDAWQDAVRGTILNYIDDYPWQVSVMMIASGLPVLMAVYNKGKPEKTIDGIPGTSALCPDKGKIHYELITEPPISYEDIIEKVSKVKALIDGPDVVQSGVQCDNPKQWPCRFQHLRPENDDGSGPVTDGLSTDDDDDRGTWEIPEEDQEEFDRLVLEYVSAKGLEDENKAIRKRALARIEEMVGKGKQTIVSYKWIVPMVKGTSTGTDWGQVSPEAKAEIDAAKTKNSYFYLRDIKRRD